MQRYKAKVCAVTAHSHWVISAEFDKEVKVSKLLTSCSFLEKRSNLGT